jgi:hypothetical protein
MSEAISIEKARAAKSAAKQLLAKLLGDVAIGITRIGDDYALKVNLPAPPPDSVVLPKDVDGVPIRFEVTGTISKRIDTGSRE